MSVSCIILNVLCIKRWWTWGGRKSNFSDFSFLNDFLSGALSSRLFAVDLWSKHVVIQKLIWEQILGRWCTYLHVLGWCSCICTPCESTRDEILTLHSLFTDCLAKCAGGGGFPPREPHSLTPPSLPPNPKQIAFVLTEYFFKLVFNI